MMRKNILSLVILLYSVILFGSCDKNTDDDSSLFYTVSVESNGGTNIAPIRIKPGQKIPMDRLYPSPIVLDGGKFNGWYADETLKEAFNFNTAINDNITIYAKWQYVTHTVNFEMDGAPSKEAIDAIEGRNLIVEKPTWEGKVFAGWYRDQGFTNLYKSTSKVTDSFTLYARWVNPSPAEWFGINNDVLVSCTPPVGTEILVVPEGVKTIGEWFLVANNLHLSIKEVIMPESVEHIGRGSFYSSAVERVTIPHKVKDLYDYTFHNCSKLKYFNFADNSETERFVGALGLEPVLNAPLLEHISFPPSFKEIGMYTMVGCSGLKTVTFERSESPVVMINQVPTVGGIWLFEGHFPQTVRMPDEVKAGFLSGIRALMGDYEYGRWSSIIETY